MNKTLYLIVSLVITGLLATLSIDVWRSHEFIKTQGIEGTLRIGQRYNTSRWAEPLPLKKIHVYTATLAPNHAVIIESDQDFGAGQEVFIRYLQRSTRSSPNNSPYLRPIPGSIRLRTEADGTPLKIDPTTPQERLLEKAMGSAAAPPSSTRIDGTVDPNPAQPATAFLVGGANDGVMELIWNNSRAGEWVLLGLALFLLQAFAINAWTLPWREYKPVEQDKDFVHPSLEHREPDAPRAPVARISLKPKPAVPEPESPVKSEPVRETDHVLKLPRK
ncbi:MAG TPA: hypothetical protein VK961_18375 [Chthoniobacter sp.]|nr:hypothetical protein [Chthoniobacter sp.]